MSLPISLCIFAKDNEDSIHFPIVSVKELVSEIILVDTGSSDRTPEIAKDLGARVYHVGFTDFGKIRTLTQHLAKEEWVLMLDSDETLSSGGRDELERSLYSNAFDVYGIPRRRWLDLNKSHQTETQAYPDYQYRLMRNKPNDIWWENRVHERLVISDHIKIGNMNSLHIEHFQDVFKFGEKLKKRNEMYKRLYKLDQEDGITRSVPAVAELDDI